jgi:hypothetical protein
MEIVAFYKCYDHYEARMKEQEHFISLNATLNSIEPFPKPKEMPLQENITVSEEGNLMCINNDTKKHINKMEDFEIPLKNPNRFFCETCDFKCYMKCDWDRHIKRPKHFSNIAGNKKESKKLNTNDCCCGKSFLSKSGLWKHKKGCNDEITDNPTDKEIIMLLIKENSELKNLVLDVLQKIQPVNNIS